MPPASNEEQFKFLISCIRYSNNGKVDFGQVAKECKIVTKGAAAKRYERMMRSHGIAPNAATIKPAPNSRISAANTGIKPDPSTPVKKRKLVDGFPGGDDGDDEELFAGRIKHEIKNEKDSKAGIFKQESGVVHGESKVGIGGVGVDLGDVNKELMNYYTNHDAPIFDDGSNSEEPYGMGSVEGSEYTHSEDNIYGRSMDMGAFQMQGAQVFGQYPDFSGSPDMGHRMGSQMSMPRMLGQGGQYQQGGHFDNQGQPDSPLLVE